MTTVGNFFRMARVYAADGRPWRAKKHRQLGGGDPTDRGMSTTFAHLRRAASAPSPQPPRRSPHRRRLLGILLSLCGVAAPAAGRPRRRLAARRACRGGGLQRPEELAQRQQLQEPVGVVELCAQRVHQAGCPHPTAGHGRELRPRLGQDAGRSARRDLGPRLGAYWDERDLVNKWFLNQAELPPPDDACQKPGNRGEGKRRHDANGDGVFNVQDYTTVSGHEQPEAAKICDPRLRDQNGNGILDPQDLIVAFSDKKDDDRNGYIDDIAGWDFFRNDNDAYDDTRYGHGTGEAKDSSAEADNGRAEAGVCPRCRVMPLRVGDSFVADSNDFAVATVYAVDIGASVVQEALGTIDNTPLSRWAIDYAYDNHVAVIASAADENSYHHNFPGTNNHPSTSTPFVPTPRSRATPRMPLRSITARTMARSCSLSVPGESCSSEATGRSSGMAGLIYSAALAADLPAPPRLHPPTAGDTAPAGDGGPAASRVRRLSAKKSGRSRWAPPTALRPQRRQQPGGLSHRPGLCSALRLRPRERPQRRRQHPFRGHPAEVEIEKAGWFQVFGERDGTVPIEGRIAIRHGKPEGDSFDFEVAWLQVSILATSASCAWGMARCCRRHWKASWPTCQWRRSRCKTQCCPSTIRQQPDDRAHIYTITVRVRVLQRSADPRRNGLRSEARRAVHIHTDPDLLPGFPKRLGASGETSLKTADLNGDGRREIIVADAGGLVHALRADGTRSYPASRSRYPISLRWPRRRPATTATRVGASPPPPIVRDRAMERRSPATPPSAISPGTASPDRRRDLRWSRGGDRR